MCILLSLSSEDGRVGRLPKPSTSQSRRFPKILKDLTFVSKLSVSLAKPTMEFESESGFDFV